MGITIHYKGILKPDVSREYIIELVSDLSNSLKWKITNIEENEFDLKGLIIKPHPNCESLNFVFTNDGQLINFFAFSFNKENNTEPIIDDSIKYCSCKTQFSPPAIHITIIKLLEFLHKQYFQELNIHDEGGYYPDGDTEELIHRMDKINDAIDILEDVLNSGDSSGQNTEMENITKIIKRIEELFEKILEQLRKNMK